MVSERLELHLYTSFPNDLDQHLLCPLSIELAIEDLLPRPKVELGLRNCHNDLTPHDLPLQVCISIVLSGSVVMVHVGVWVKRCQLLKPNAEVVMQATLIVIDENRRSDVHRIAKNQSLLNAALANRLFDLRGDVDEAHCRRHIHGQVFGVGFHACVLARKQMAGQV
jgi:hypothetical protein